METEQLYRIFKEYQVITTDSRNIPQKSLFFALKGSNFNGNLFAGEALQKGASYVVVDDPSVVINDRYLLVDDVLKSLQKLASFHRKQLEIPIIAITGTNGKTTTKELASVVLSEKYNTAFTKGNLNNHIGVPLTLLSMTGQTEIGVVEMGANHPGEIKALCQIAEPDFGIITNIGKAHLEGFGSFEGIIQTKTEMYRFLSENNGKCFVNADNDILMNESNGIERITYGHSSDNYLYGEPMESDYNVVVKTWFPQGWLYLKSKLIGNYNVENVLAAACIGKYFEVDPIKLQKAIEAYIPSNNRSQLIQREKNTLIMDAYNANPTSMKAAIQNFLEIKGDNKCLILGDMLELGQIRDQEHQFIVDMIEKSNFDEVFLVGTCFAKTNTQKDQKKFDHSDDLFEYLKQNPLEGKLILIKGSRGIQLEKVVDFL